MNPDLIVYSDYICPFCFIGKLRIDAMVSEFGLTAEWRPFELRPEGTPLPDPEGEYLKNAWANVFRLAEEVGLDVRRPSCRPRSRLALEGGEFAKDAGKFEAYNRLVFEAFFQHDKDLGDPAVLRDIAAEAGMDADAFAAALEDGAYTQRVLDSHRKGEADRVNGVPLVLIGDDRIEGAQSYAVFRSAAERYCAMA